MSEDRKKELAKKGKKEVSSSKGERLPRLRGETERYPRVIEMFRKPADERWKVAKDFTVEERNYARRLAKRDLAEEKRLDQICSWDGGGDDGEIRLERFSGITEGCLGESDDGSI